jgi:hypothetical protein
MEPAARARLSSSLAAEAVRYTSPIPPVDAETFVRAVVAVRRAREQRALELEGVRVEELLKGVR